MEVIVLIQIIAGYRFVEAKQYLVIAGKNTIRRIGFAKYARHACILYTAHDCRWTCDESVSVAAERYSAQVILLLHRVTLAVETDILDTSAADHSLRTRCPLIEAVVRIIRAEVDPCFVALRRQFVLELDMIEITIVHIKAVDDYRQIPSG